MCVLCAFDLVNFHSLYYQFQVLQIKKKEVIFAIPSDYSFCFNSGSDLVEHTENKFFKYLCALENNCIIVMSMTAAQASPNVDS